MIAVVTAVVVIALVTRAGGSPTASSGDMIRDLQAIDERACSCEGAECTKQVYADSNQWVASYASRIDSYPNEVRGEVLDLTSDAKACLDDAEAGARPRSRIAELRMWAGFQHQMCECRDSACADGVEKEMLAKGATSRETDTEVDHRIDQRAKKLLACDDQAHGGPTPQSRVSK